MLNMRVADVNKCLLSVCDMLHKNQRVMFDLDGSYIEDKITGDRIDIMWENNSPVVEFQVVEPLPEDQQLAECPELTPFDMDTDDEALVASSSSSGLYGPVQSDQPAAPGQPFQRQAPQL